MAAQPVRIGDLSLDCGHVLKEVEIAYEMLGELAANRANVVLALHGFTSGSEMILPTGQTAEGSWRDLVGPGRAIDTDVHCVICPNALGSTYGSTGAASLNPDTGRPYGSSFPPLTLGDIVRSQRALLDQLSVDRIVAAVGPSFGGMQALQWGVSYPDCVGGVVAALTSLGPPPTDVEHLRARLELDPAWHGGDYYGRGDMSGTLVDIRLAMLKSYGVDEALAATVSDPETRRAMMEDRARAWARTFDANALLTIIRAMSSFDVTGELDRMRAPVLYVLSSSDAMFPPTLAPVEMARFRAAGVEAEYFEIEGPNGHAASSSDAVQWAPTLRRFLDRIGTC